METQCQRKKKKVKWTKNLYKQLFILPQLVRLFVNVCCGVGCHWLMGEIWNKPGLQSCGCVKFTKPLVLGLATPGCWKLVNTKRFIPHMIEIKDQFCLDCGQKEWGVRDSGWGVKDCKGGWRGEGGWRRVEEGGGGWRVRGERCGVRGEGWGVRGEGWRRVKAGEGGQGLRGEGGWRSVEENGVKWSVLSE